MNLIHSSKMSPLAWRTVWLNKLEKKCTENGMDAATTSKYNACINGLLALYPGHPRDIDLDRINTYLHTTENFDISKAALIFFFTTVAYAPAIFGALELSAPPKTKTVPTPAKKKSSTAPVVKSAKSSKITAVKKARKP